MIQIFYNYHCPSVVFIPTSNFFNITCTSWQYFLILFLTPLNQLQTSLYLSFLTVFPADLDFYLMFWVVLGGFLVLTFSISCYFMFNFLECFLLVIKLLKRGQFSPFLFRNNMGCKPLHCMMHVLVIKLFDVVLKLYHVTDI